MERSGRTSRIIAATAFAGLSIACLGACWSLADTQGSQGWYNCTYVGHSPKGVLEYGGYNILARNPGDASDKLEGLFKKAGYNPIVVPASTCKQIPCSCAKYEVPGMKRPPRGDKPPPPIDRPPSGATGAGGATSAGTGMGGAANSTAAAGTGGTMATSLDPSQDPCVPMSGTGGSTPSCPAPVETQSGCLNCLQTYCGGNWCDCRADDLAGCQEAAFCYLNGSANGWPRPSSSVPTTQGFEGCMQINCSSLCQVCAQSSQAGAGGGIP